MGTRDPITAGIGVFSLKDRHKKYISTTFSRVALGGPFHRYFADDRSRGGMPGRWTNLGFIFNP